MDLDLPSLETFVRLADCGSFSETAKGQGITQPAVSQRVARLESAVGLRLFLRGQEGVRLTHEGSQLLNLARQVVREHDDLCVRMEHFVRESRGSVRAWIDRSMAGEALACRVAGHEELRTALEVLRPETETMDWKRALDERMVDFVIAGTFLHAGDVPGLRRFGLETQRGTTIAWNRSYFDFDAGSFSFPEALRSTILIPDEQLVSGYAGFLERWCLEAYRLLPPDIRTFRDEMSARDACIAGLGVLVFPGDARRRMNLDSTGLGTMKTFEFLLPDAYHYSVYMRSDERKQNVLQTALKVSELHLRIEA